MSGHTPGPWSVAGDDRLFVHPPDTSANVICDLVGRIYDRLAGRTQLTPEDEANARLIAAAPDLLDSVKRILAGFDAGVFVRSTKSDSESAWAIKLLPHLKALADAVAAVEKAEGAA